MKLDQFFDLLDGALDVLGRRAADEGVQGFVQTFVDATVLGDPRHAGPERSLAPDDDGALGLLLQLFQVVTSGTEDQAHEVDVRIFLEKKP